MFMDQTSPIIDICCIIKDEHEYLKEFLDHHFNIGINKIYLFEDYGSTSHKNLIKDYKNVILQTVKDFEISNYKNSSTLYDLYNKFGYWAKENNLCDWCLFIDVDEYVTFQEGYNFEKLCKEYEDYNGVLLNWANIGACGHFKKPKGLLKDNYTIERRGVLLDPSPIWNKKSLVNIKNFCGFMNIHIVNGGIDTNGSYSPFDKPVYNKAYIKHYYSKSWEDYLFRMFNRGNMSNDYRSFDLFFKISPEFLPLREELLNSVKHKKLKATMWISRELKIIAGGNMEFIKNFEKF